MIAPSHTSQDDLTKLYTDYACNAIEDPDLLRQIETQIQNCPDARREIEQIRSVLNLIDSTKSSEIRSSMIEDLEMKVYKRLASENPKDVFDPNSPKKDRFRLNNFPITKWIFGGGAIVAIVGFIFLSTVFTREPQIKTISKTHTENSDLDRIDRYQEQDLQRGFEEVIEMRHLKNDDWETTSQLHQFKEKAEGTPWADLAEQQIQVAQVATKKGL